MIALAEAVRSALAREVGTGRLGGALAVAWHDGKVVLDVAAGCRDIATRSAMAHDAIFQVASMTKPIVSVASLQLVDEGRIRLADPIARWLPEFAAPRVLDDPAGPLDHTHPAARSITVEDLLTHRAGFTYCFTAPGPLAKALEPLVDNILHPTIGPDAWLAELARWPLLREPGSRFEYGHATEVLGCLLARIDDGTLGQSLRRRVFDPLGMDDTAFFVPEARLPRLARKYRPTPTGLVDTTNVPTAPPLFEAGGGGLYSTAGEYLKFARLLLGGGEVDGVRILRAATCADMVRNHLTARQRTLEALGQPAFFAHTGFGYGVAVEIDPVPPLYLGPGSLSWGGIWGTGWRADPTRRLISLFFAQEDADTSSGPGRRDPAEGTPAKNLQAEVEALVWRAYSTAAPHDAGWVRLARRHRGDRPRAGATDKPF